jgi:hypothetical protein
MRSLAFDRATTQDGLGDRSQAPAARYAGSAPADRILGLQRAAGNRAVGRWLHGERRRRLARVGVEEVQQELKTDKKFAAAYPGWIKKTTVLAGSPEREVLAGFTMKGLKDAVDQWAVHGRNYELVKQMAGKAMSWWQWTRGDVKGFLKEWYRDELQALKKSKTLLRYAADKLGPELGKLEEVIDRALVPLPPDEFEAQYLRSTRERESSVPEAIASVDFSRGFRVGDAFYLRIGSGTPPDSVHTPVHELMHALSDPFAKSLLGHELNEGLTELITERVMGEVHTATKSDLFKWPDSAYRAERAQVRALMDHLARELSWDDPFEALLELYFLVWKPRAGLLDAVQTYRHKSPHEAVA